MANIVINKNFNKKYLWRYVDQTFKIKTTYSRWIITNDTLDATGINSSYRTVFLTNQTTLSLFDKISSHYKNIDMGDLQAYDFLSTIINTMLQTDDDTYYIRAMDKLVADGALTQEEANSIYVNKLTDVVSINASVNIDGVISFSIIEPNKLYRRYEQTVDNPTNEQMYLCFIPEESGYFIGSNYYSTLYHTAVENENVKQSLRYAAMSIGDTGTEDIVFDYTGIIDYLDTFEFNINLPRVIS